VELALALLLWVHTLTIRATVDGHQRATVGNLSPVPTGIRDTLRLRLILECVEEIRTMRPAHAAGMVLHRTRKIGTVRHHLLDDTGPAVDQQIRRRILVVALLLPLLDDLAGQVAAAVVVRQHPDAAPCLP